jgi:hypothetical protein
MAVTAAAAVAVAVCTTTASTAAARTRRRAHRIRGVENDHDPENRLWFRSGCLPRWLLDVVGTSVGVYLVAHSGSKVWVGNFVAPNEAHLERITLLSTKNYPTRSMQKDPLPPPQTHTIDRWTVVVLQQCVSNAQSQSLPLQILGTKKHWPAKSQ